MFIPLSRSPINFKKPYIFIALLFCLILSACQISREDRLEKAQMLAFSGGFEQRDLPAGPFLIRAYERFADPGNDVMRLYIEGDGLAWLNKSQPSLDPTPVNPMGLLLAKEDYGPNIAYMARPCQYNRKLLNGAACPSQYWRGARFAREVITATNAAIDDIKRRHEMRKIELVGYSGGAGLAVLVAAERDDVVSIRTVAGNLDSDAFTDFHHVTPMELSINPADAARKINAIPQLHFIGGKDKVVPEEIYQSFRQRSDDAACVHSMIIEGATHEKGWIERWPMLLQQEISCPAPSGG